MKKILLKILMWVILTIRRMKLGRIIMNSVLSSVLTNAKDGVAKFLVGATGNAIRQGLSMGLSATQMADVFAKIGDSVQGTAVTYTGYASPDVAADVQYMVEGGTNVFNTLITGYKLQGLEAPIGGVLKAAAPYITARYPVVP